MYVCIYVSESWVVLMKLCPPLCVCVCVWTQSEVVHCAGLLDELVVDPMTMTMTMTSPSVGFDGGKSPPSPTGVIIVQQHELGMDATWPGAGDGDSWPMPLLLLKRMAKRQRREE